MRILIMNQHVNDHLGGSEIQCDLIATNLTKLGHEVFYGAINSLGDENSKSYEVLPIKKLTIMAYYRILNNVKPDIVYWRYDRKFLLKAGIISKLRKCKIVFSISHVKNVTKWGYRPNLVKGNIIKKVINYYSIFKHSLINRLNYLGFYFMDGVVSLSEDLLKLAPKKFNESNKVHIYNSMQISIEKEFEWPKPYIVWVANIKQVKNPEKYIAIAEKLHGIDVDFLMIGKIQEKSFNYILESEKLPSNVHYLGSKKVSEVDEILKNSLFMIHTCNPEGFGNNFIQAWLLGKPTVTLYFDPDSIIENYNIGYFSGSLEKMEKQVLELINDNDLRYRMGNASKMLAIELFNPKKNAQKLEGFFNNILN